MKRTLPIIIIFMFTLGLVFKTNAQFVNIGTSTTVHDNYDAGPINTWYKSLRYQVVYTAAELTANGALPGDIISGLGWYVSTASPQALPSYTIKLKNTSATNSNVFDGAGLTSVVTLPSYSPTAGGYDVINFTTNYVWNGTSNLLVDVCFSPTSNWSSSGTVRTFAGTSRYDRDDYTNMCGQPTYDNLPFRPIIRLKMAGGTPPSCIPPSNISGTNLFANSIDLSWNPGAGLYFLTEIGPAGYTPNTGTATVSTQGINVTESFAGLTSSTYYDAYVTAICPNGDTLMAVGPYSFLTPCSTENAPYLETFDASITTPLCWTNTNLGYYNWIFYASNSNVYPSPEMGVSGVVDHTSGIGNFAFVDADGGLNNNELISPVINFSNLTQGVVGCWVYSNNPNNNVQNILRIDAWDGTAWAPVLTYFGNFAGWKRIYVAIPASIPTTTQFRLKQLPSIAGGSLWYNEILVDDFFVDESPTCFEPTALMDSIIDPYTAHLSWTTGGASNWIVEYGPIGFTPGTGTTVSTSSNPTIITGLTPGTDYGWFVRDECSPNNISWASSADRFRLPGVVLCDTLNTFTYCHPVESIETFTYQSESGTGKLHFKFNSGITGSYVTFTIYDGPDNTYPILYSGMGGNNLAGVEFTSTSSIVTFTWNSIYANNCNTPLNFVVNCCVPTSSFQKIFICENTNYTLANNTVVSAGAYSIKIPNVLGCDSSISYLILELPSVSSQTGNLCLGSTYTFADGTTTSTPGIFQVTVPNQLGCDSTINYNINAAASSSYSMNASTCQGVPYIMPDNSSVSTSGTYTATLVNALGCDSVVTVNLTVNLPSTETKNVTICEGQSYVLPDGISVSAAGTYTSNSVNQYNCPKVITTNVTVSNITFAEVVVEICGDDTYTLLNGDVVRESGEYNVSVVNNLGCDSIVTVFVSKCSAIGDLDESVLSIYPNPARSILNVLLSDAVVNNVEFKIINSLGQTIYINSNVEKNELKINVENFSNGLYFIVLSNNEGSSLHKFMISK